MASHGSIVQPYGFPEQHFVSWSEIFARYYHSAPGCAYYFRPGTVGVLEMPDGALFKNRGGVVLLGEKIEAGCHLPRQLLAARALPVAASKTKLLSHLTCARRSAAAEGAYLVEQSRGPGSAV